ncbi:MBL fold metallo-hydrolase [Kamptonema cortianum]|uniref:MBL fold metallo-hydrolase n=1 Tax=Geitlerinema calcuttense NRMC-F 0142 TaxID=2922238 RepID=A0ABT7LXD7_9CYAN|nr:MBL fold metallo-hydrolase [Geitlerinema calcuttense]MDK3155531.1 MBL fold metallo-hydrolase [Kamptonema cortianum]MDL5056677.1 MBL fold metallo-hydrolase [Geitlerinema calcuttense NRMC-F 0142]
MTQLIFLGSGSAFTVGADNFQSNLLLINSQNQKLLIDCGTDIRLSLHAAGFSHRDITDIYISHLHSDHSGGLEYIGFATKFDPNCSSPNLYISEDLAGDLWEKTLAGGMASIEGSIAQLNTFFQVCPVPLEQSFQWSDIEFKLVRVKHIHNGQFTVPSYGLFFKLGQTKVFFTSDIQFALECVWNLYEQADLIFQDTETAKYPSKVHAHYQDLCQLPAEIKRKMWLYHYQPGVLPNAIEDGFQGFVKRGQIFDFSQDSLQIL